MFESLLLEFSVPKLSITGFVVFASLVSDLLVSDLTGI